MRVGVPSEVKNHEYRVALTPAGVHELVGHEHEVFVQRGAGVGSSIPDEDFAAAGAKVLDTAQDVWGTAQLVLKVKEPIAEEYERMRADQVLFTYLHLAASWLRAPRRSPTRPCSYPTARCHCSPPCQRSPVGWRRKPARTSWSAPRAAAAC